MGSFLEDDLKDKFIIEDIFLVGYNPNDKDTSLIIPNEVEVLVKDCICDDYSELYQEFDNINTLFIPKSVFKIEGSKTLAPLTKLNKIEVDKENVFFTSIGNCLIEKKSNKIIRGCSNSIIPNDGSVDKIGDAAFYRCENIIDLVIPDCITSIGCSAFACCENLRSIKLSSSLREICSAAFTCCTNLKSVVIPSGVITIGDDAFSGCDNLETILIPSSVLDVGDFSDCSKLTIICEKESAAYKYAIENDIKYEMIDI